MPAGVSTFKHTLSNLLTNVLILQRRSGILNIDSIFPSWSERVLLAPWLPRAIGDQWVDTGLSAMI